MSHRPRSIHSYAPYVNQEIISKRPPGWDPAYNKDYPYETWYQDMTHWLAATDVAEPQRGALVVLQLGGLAREFARDLDAITLQDGGAFDLDGTGQQMQIPGVFYLMW